MLNLAQFSGGTDDRYKDTLGTKMAHVIYTGGVKYVAEKAAAYWLIDDICLYQIDKTNPQIRKEPFQSWKLTTKDSKGVLTCEDGNGKVVFKRDILFTDFPEPEITLWLIYDGNPDATLLLPQEY